MSNQGSDKHYLEILRKISLEAVLGSTPGERLSKLVEIVATELYWDVCSIYLLESDKKEIVLTATYGLVQEAVGKVRLPVSEGVVGDAVLQDKAVFLETASVDTRYKYFPETGEEKYMSMAAVPFSSDGQVTGVLTVQTVTAYKFTSADIHFLEILASQIGQAVDAALSLKALNQRKESIIVGTPAAPGVAEARVHIIASTHDRVEILARGFKSIEFEKQLFNNALSAALIEIKNFIDQMGDPLSPGARIFSAHQMILKDVEFSSQVHYRIENKQESAPRVVAEIMEEYIKKFAAFKSSVMKEKVQDIKDLRDTLFKHMGENVTELTPNFTEEEMVIVGREITPQETLRLDLDKVKAFVTETGSEFSHAAILARSLQLPAVVGIPDLEDLIKPGDRLLVDGNSGFIYINPDTQLREQYMEKVTARQDKIKAIRSALEENPENNEPCCGISLNANIGLPFEIDHAIQEKMQSVGLLRTEFFYMQQQSWPDIDTQTRFYERHLQNFQNGEVTIRLLDIGGDKFLSYLPDLHESNSQLGFRSIRLLLDHTELLRSQLLAIHRAACNTGQSPKILIPMVTHAWEVSAVREIMMEVTSGIQHDLGIMIETPIALYQIEELTSEADFVSIGTNDLTQYLLAVDRNNPKVTHLYHPLHPAILRALDSLYKSLCDRSKTFTVCGEMAGDPVSSLALLILGYRGFSISPVHAPGIQYLFKQIPESILETQNQALLAATSAKESEKLLRSLIKKYAPLLF